MRVIIFLLLNAAAHATELSVAHHKLQYSVKITSESLEFHEGHTEWKTTTKSCNKELLKRFQSEINHIFIGPPLRMGTASKSVVFQWYGKNYNEPKDTKRAKQLLRLPASMREFIIEEKLRCLPVTAKKKKDNSN